MTSTDERLEELETKLARRTRWFALTTGVLVVALYLRTRPDPTPAPLVHATDFDAYAHVDPPGLRVAGTTLAPDGMLAMNVDRSEEYIFSAIRSHESEAELKLQTARASFQVHVGAESPIVEALVKGKVSSRLLVDTNTGEWRLVRSRLDATGNPSDTQELVLVAPLAGTDATAPDRGR